MQRYGALIALVLAFSLFGCASESKSVGGGTTPTTIKEEPSGPAPSKATVTLESTATTVSPPLQPTNTPALQPTGTPALQPTATSPAVVTATPQPPTTTPPATQTPVLSTPTPARSLTSTPVPSFTATTVAQRPKPDLIITDFRLAELGTCAPGTGETVYKLSVTVKNQGSALSPVVDKAVLIALDQHGNGWGGGVMGDELGVIAAGASKTVTVKVFFYGSDPEHIRALAPHPFKATVDHLGLIDELDETNNDSGIIYLPAPAGCP